jgi:outer membrane protein assembly factor BamB
MKTILSILILFNFLSSCGMSGSIKISGDFKRGEIADWPNIGGSALRDNYRDVEFRMPLRLIWKKSVSSAVNSVIAVSDSIIYFGTLDGRVYAMNLRNGNIIGTLKFLYASTSGFSIQKHTAIIGLANGKETLISYDVFDGRYNFIKQIGAIESNPLIYDEYVYVAAENKKFHCLNLADGLILWTFETGKPVRSSPAVHGTTVYFGCDDGNVYALNRFNGNVIWKFQTKQAVFAAPAMDETTLYVGSTDSVFYAIHIKDGSLKWKHKIGSVTPGTFFASAAVDGSKVVVGGSDGIVYAFDKQSGKLLWKFQTQGAISTAPVITKNYVFAGSQDKNFYAIDGVTGLSGWKYPMEGRVKTNLAIYGDYVIVASENKYVYMFKSK